MVVVMHYKFFLLFIWFDADVFILFLLSFLKDTDYSWIDGWFGFYGCKSCGIHLAWQTILCNWETTKIIIHSTLVNCDSKYLNRIFFYYLGIGFKESVDLLFTRFLNLMLQVIICHWIVCNNYISFFYRRFISNFL